MELTATQALHLITALDTYLGEHPHVHQDLRETCEAISMGAQLSLDNLRNGDAGDIRWPL